MEGVMNRFALLLILAAAGLVQLRQLLHQEPLIAMGFRFHRSARLGPLRFHFSNNGLSWSTEHSPDRPAPIPAGAAEGLPNSRRLRPGQLDALKQELLGVLRQELFAPGSPGERLWDHGLVSRLLTDGSIGARTTGLLALIETPEAMESYLLRAQGQDDAKRRARRCVEAVQAASRLAAGRGWLG